MKNTKQMKINRYIPSILTGIICIAIVVCIAFIPNSKNEPIKIDLSEYSSIEDICELATLKSYYHNVAVYEEKPGDKTKLFNDIMFWPFGNLTKTGYKQFWMEYNGVVKTGIDAKQISISGPDENGSFDVFIPDAKVMDVSAESLSKPLTEKGLFTSISTEEQTQAFASAQSALRKEAESDQKLLGRAKNNAKRLLEQYIINTGKQMNVNYSVNWIEKPI